jgi:hypothetical protein
LAGGWLVIIGDYWWWLLVVLTFVLCPMLFLPGKKNAVAGGKTEGKTEGKTGGGQLPRRGSHAIERAAANNGMSQDHHASVTMAGTMRRQISDAEN